jgi:stress-induced morphogen
MAMDAVEIERLIKEALPGAVIVIEDLRGDGDHYAAHVAAQFGMTRIQQHQMVYQALREDGRQLHALAPDGDTEIARTERTQ